MDKNRSRQLQRQLFLAVLEQFGTCVGFSRILTVLLTLVSDFWNSDSLKWKNAKIANIHWIPWSWNFLLKNYFLAHRGLEIQLKNRELIFVCVWCDLSVYVWLYLCQCPVSSRTQQEDAERYISPPFQPPPLLGAISAEKCPFHWLRRHASEPQSVQRCHRGSVCKSHHAHP